MTELVWSATRDDAIARFHGQTPGAQVEEEILEAFLQHPLRVVEEIKRVATKLDSGKITSAWPILRLNVREAANRRDATVTDASDRNARIEWCEQWIRTAGLHFDRESELLDELFGDRGKLLAWAGDEVLRQRMVALWEFERPKGLLVEAESERVAAERVLLAKTLLARERAALSMQETQEAEVTV